MTAGVHRGLTIANHGDFADPGWLADVAVAAEATGWEGVFVWDHIARTGQPAMTDPWIALAAIATRTTRVRLGPMVTPLPRRRPWKVAREVAALDQLSAGRVVLGVGLGTHPLEFDAVGEETDLRRRAAMLDEGLLLLRHLWSGEVVDHAGEAYVVSGVRHTPTPVQRPVPIWVAGRWPNRKPMVRAARFQGAFPITEGGMAPADTAAVCAFLAAQRDQPDDAPTMDIVHEGTTEPGADLSDFADAGLTWWLERMAPEHRGREEVMARVAAGPA